MSKALSKIFITMIAEILNMVGFIFENLPGDYKKRKFSMHSIY